ncbi:MAG TPA: hypothetical protein VEU33_10120 [Archangium sp.]|nr:hypothetical protein [Archangium sp.]
MPVPPRAEWRAAGECLGHGGGQACLEGCPSSAPYKWADGTCRACPPAAPVAWADSTCHTCPQSTPYRWRDGVCRACPEVDRDGDGVCDLLDPCPDVYGTTCACATGDVVFDAYLDACQDADTEVLRIRQASNAVEQALSTQRTQTKLGFTAGSDGDTYTAWLSGNTLGDAAGWARIHRICPADTTPLACPADVSDRCASDAAARQAWMTRIEQWKQELRYCIDGSRDDWSDNANYGSTLAERICGFYFKGSSFEWQRKLVRNLPKARAITANLANPRPSCYDNSNWQGPHYHMFALGLVDYYSYATLTALAAHEEYKEQVKANAGGQVDWAYFDWNTSQAQAFDLARGDRMLEQNSISPTSLPY